ncbi:pyridoxamine 5'-phosphate oxidase family protein [Heliobacterium gestii]|uniref:Pyridoxamine 5'-phosphate oxidase family protein n=1 Tax=Heliomicrobium gestii TaxID=2699 RepID=A0A845LF40_HELGE|nr:pyridoxamine 5'-phosphate oxidase family protein [Heliomicrobium gestii]MBM7867788.1 nitroimidazol reductase NimA-like FMN-containing flavoprotein (pyridoxamine 5'-phosphate oxidase superfamily) [Heliomicrobium gestii]MZP44181.1 pyridoxamine 5'-phosphate oxidase family protein [Heliomicrobium gestii]
MFRTLRKQERELASVETIELLRTGEYGILSTVGEEGYAYGVPVSYAYFDEAVYVHCAPEGHKVDNIRYNDKVSFCVVGKTCLLPEKFSTKYESVILFGRASEVCDQEKRAALVKLIEKYSPDHRERGEAYIEKACCQTRVIKIAVEHITGKARK